MDYEPVARMTIGSGKLLPCIIILGRVTEGVVCELDEVRHGLKVNLIFIMAPMCILSKAVICPNPRKEVIYKHATSIKISSRI